MKHKHNSIGPKDMFYRRLSGGFRATPQGRIIFYIDVNGINRGWQPPVMKFIHQLLPQQ